MNKILLDKLKHEKTRVILRVVGYLVIIVLGFYLRLLLSTKGVTPDFVAYADNITLTELNNSYNIYALTESYNYGPVWYFTLLFLNKVDQVFGWIDLATLISLFLGFVDLCISVLLYLKVSKKVAILYFLNPVSILVSGFWRQFDNYAILFALMSVLVFKEYFEKKKLVLLIIANILLGISIDIKHIFIVFPFWLILSEKRKSNTLWYFLPYAIFVGSFLPFLTTTAGREGVVNNVLSYTSTNFSPLLTILGFTETPNLYIPISFIFLALILIVGLFVRRKNAIEKMDYYLFSFLALTPAIAAQYLAIVALPVIRKLNINFVIFMLTASVFLFPFFFNPRIVNWEGRIMIPMCFYYAGLITLLFYIFKFKYENFRIYRCL